MFNESALLSTFDFVLYTIGMIIRYSKIKGCVIGEMKDQVYIGRVSEVIIDNQNIKVAAIAFDQSNLFYSKSQFIMDVDIVHIFKDGVVIKDDESLIDLEESSNLKRFIDDKSYGTGQKVVTESDEYLGKVYDFLIDNETLAITKFYIKHYFDEKIIPSTKIVKFENGVITIKDNKRVKAAEIATVTETASA